jgi:hypothetical protein
MRYLTSHGPFALQLAGAGARAKLGRPTAITDALRDARWHPASATGISLVRISPTGRNVAHGELAWLVSVKPHRSVYDGSRTSRGPAGNYFVVLVSARDGRFVGSADGYSPELAGRAGGPGWAEAELSSSPGPAPPGR